MAGGMMPVFTILLAGGFGTRLWPVSRQLHPKQVARFSGEPSLIQSTIERLSPIMDTASVLVVCGEAHSPEISRQVEAVGIDAEKRVLVEPYARNTAPAILLAVASILRTESDALVCIFPSDHAIRDDARFCDHVSTALLLAGRGHIVTFGIKPDYPETGYGYIEGGDPVEQGALRIKRFVEKPDQKHAKQYIESGNFFWNSGMFAFRASVVIQEFQAYCPQLYAQMNRYLDADTEDRKGIYRSLDNISIDYAVMEKTDKGVVLPSDFGWSDIGSWKSLFDFLKKDENGNVIQGDVVLKDTRDSLILAHSRLIAVNRIENTAVVETPDAVLVSDLENSRDVKSIVDFLIEKKRSEHRQHRTWADSWGQQTHVFDAADCRVLRRIINPGAVCRLKRSHAYSRYLFVTRGTAKITSDPDGEIVHIDGVTTVPKGVAVDISNAGENELIIMEIVKTEGDERKAEPNESAVVGFKSPVSEHTRRNQ